jgi:hypothetical protein
MLEARTVALVGASPRPGTFGERMVEEVARSPAAPEFFLVNPKYAEIGGRRCYRQQRNSTSYEAARFGTFGNLRATADWRLKINRS